MKFYDCATAPSPRRVRIFIAEKGIDLETVQVDLSSGEQFSDAFRAINPDCVVPALVLDDGTCLSEVTAICQYLEEYKPEPTLWGDNATERAQSILDSYHPEHICAETYALLRERIDIRVVSTSSEIVYGRRRDHVYPDARFESTSSATASHSA